jgi:hypothetical protein
MNTYSIWTAGGISELVILNFPPRFGRQTGSYPDTGLEEINGDLLEEDFCSFTGPQANSTSI